MVRNRIYRTFAYREAVFRICCEAFDAVAHAIVRQRRLLEDYIRRHPAFGSSFEPVELLPDAPEIARRMVRAGRAVGVGPMAAVAGAMAQWAAEAGLKAGAAEAIVDNGGDIYLQAAEPVAVGLHAGMGKPANRLAFSLQPTDMPVAICSSSGRMGHSMSLGRCDLATVVARDAALADAVATQAANVIRTVGDMDAALERIGAIDGVDGLLIVQDDRVGLAGHLPPLVRSLQRVGHRRNWQVNERYPS
jgi:hypothetical protein